MSVFRTTADLVDAALNRAGESTSGTSPYEADALTYLNKIYTRLIGGGLVFKSPIDEAWQWAKARNPFTIELQPKQNTGTVTLTQGSDAGTFSSAPSVSLAGWFIREIGAQTLYKIMAHTAGDTAFELDAFFVGTTGSGKSFEAFKLDYDVIPSHIYIESGINDKIDFVRSGTTQVTATLTPGAYTPAALASHAQTVIQAAAGGTSTYGCTYDSVTGKFTFTSDTLLTDVFYFLWATGTNAARSAGPTFGFDYTDSTNADSHTGNYRLGGVSRLCSPARSYKASFRTKDITGMEGEAFRENFPLATVREADPKHFAIVREQGDGLLTIRFDSYPNAKMKIELPVIPVPLDLKDNAVSIPILPRKDFDILEYGAAYFLCIDKNDDRADRYLSLASAQLDLMQTENRAQNKRIDPNFGEFIARPDQTTQARPRIGGYETR